MSESSGENFVYRYLKSSDIKGDVCWSTIDSTVSLTHAAAKDFIEEATFDLRAGETDVSFFRSRKSDDTNRILDVLNELRYRRSGGGFSVNSGMMKLDFEIAHEDLNDEGEVVLFTDNDKTNRECRHYGLYIRASTNLERLEIVNALLEMSRFFALKKKAKNPDTRDLLEFQEPGGFFVIAQDVHV